MTDESELYHVIEKIDLSSPAAGLALSRIPQPHSAAFTKQSFCETWNARTDIVYRNTMIS